MVPLVIDTGWHNNRQPKLRVAKSQISLNGPSNRVTVFSIAGAPLLSMASSAAARRLLLLRHRHGNLLPKRHFSSSSAPDGLDDGGGRVKIFDRDLKRRHRDRAAWVMR